MDNENESAAEMKIRGFYPGAICEWSHDSDMFRVEDGAGGYLGEGTRPDEAWEDSLEVIEYIQNLGRARVEKATKDGIAFLDGVLYGIFMVEGWFDKNDPEVQRIFASVNAAYDELEAKFKLENKVKYININGQRIDNPPNPISYQQVVDLADSGRSKKCLHTICYHGGPDGKYEGCMSPVDKPMFLKNGMHFSAYVTDGA